MNDYWLCVNCDSIVYLNRHGRCSSCGSDSVVRRSLEHLQLISRLWPEEQDEQLAQLEGLWQKS